MADSNTIDITDDMKAAMKLADINESPFDYFNFKKMRSDGVKYVVLDGVRLTFDKHGPREDCGSAWTRDTIAPVVESNREGRPAYYDPSNPKGCE